MRFHLFIDADDTLWENNIYFERAFAGFAGFLRHSTLSAEQVRAVLDRIEGVNNRIHGYGARNFARNLRECFEQLAERPVGPEDIEYIDAIGRSLADHAIELIDGVEKTLIDLGARHELTLFTKGDPAEQRAKIGRSGIGGHFHHREIVREKNRAAYQAMIAARRLEPARCWMIGNSPKSDINPALEAGMSAVFIPHPNTWRLEKEEIRDGGGRLLVLERFSDLAVYF